MGGEVHLVPFKSQLKSKYFFNPHLDNATRHLGDAIGSWLLKITMSCVEFPPHAARQPRRHHPHQAHAERRTLPQTHHRGVAD